MVDLINRVNICFLGFILAHKGRQKITNHFLCAMQCLEMYPTPNFLLFVKGSSGVVTMPHHTGTVNQPPDVTLKRTFWLLVCIFLSQIRRLDFDLGSKAPLATLIRGGCVCRQQVFRLSTKMARSKSPTDGRATSAHIIMGLYKASLLCCLLQCTLRRSNTTVGVEKVHSSIFHQYKKTMMHLVAISADPELCPSFVGPPWLSTAPAWSIINSGHSVKCHSPICHFRGTFFRIGIGKNEFTDLS